ncbi:ABC transporter related protein [Cellulomonas flavigena DSM 20109]|uniref:ABC transporter related protein n=1 Tax=Cellulomonas flavigena (strain ATCC 482 / DSM 20109 / BCRC 11376 / JCM 18109 / NBRC 3775 / NCIMB 8073 / NRS 134) TaxID=446466 RepID=D5UDG5_CELFN|nr:ABC transporter ATP-binding protein [Cellulomonas flavigena]ADG76421.1 ABC transporter related protein [Cellulomonas flavigena DSM 20109]
MAPVIDVHALTKSFGAVRALDGLDLTVDAGEVHGFLGPNGAGKSTTIRVLLGLLRADAGTVRLFGADPWSQAVELHRRLAYVPGDVSLWPKLTGGEVIDLLASLRGPLDQARKAELLERFDLDPTKRTRTYSKGNRQKVALVAALAGDVDLLVLDEPTSGLDPLMERVFQQCVTEATARGTTVLLSSHILAEVEKLCDRVTIIRAGRTVQSGSLDELRHLTRSTVRLTTPHGAQAIAAVDGVHDVTGDGGRLTFTVDDTALSRVLGTLAAMEVRNLVVAPPTLEELFVHHYDGGAVRTDASSTAGGAR